jgi:hypothetical protein
MGKKNSKKAAKPAKQTETTSNAGPGRPSTFPAGTTVVAFPTRVSEESLTQLRWLAANRTSPFGLPHNSIGAELSRIVAQAYNKAKGSKRSSETEATPDVAPSPAEAAPIEAEVVPAV